MRSLFVLMLALSVARIAGATIPPPEKLLFGGREYFTPQWPMLGLWDYGDGKVPEGMRRAPAFDSQGSGNKDYDAVFEIRDSKLYLNQIEGKIDEKVVRNEQILPDRRFPAVVDWFTGVVYMPVGDYDDVRHEYIAVLAFEIEKGVVRKTRFAERMKLVDMETWNGLPPVTTPQRGK